MSLTNTTASKPQLARQDWESAALDMIAERGLAGLAIEPLSRQLAVTKGSFYWHFSDRKDLLQAALQRWESTDQHNLDALLNVDLPAKEKLAAFFHANSHQHRTHQVYAALISGAGSAADNSWLRDLINRVDNQRLQRLTQVYLELDTATAPYRARLAYYAYVGYLQMQSRGAVPGQVGEINDGQYLDYLIETLVL